MTRILFVLLCSVVAARAGGLCKDSVSTTRAPLVDQGDIDRELLIHLQHECPPAGCSQKSMATAVAKTVQSVLSKTRQSYQVVRGYSLLIGVMVASSVASTYLPDVLPKYLVPLLGPLTTIGIFTTISSILERRNSAWRQKGFKLSYGQTGTVTADEIKYLEDLWPNSQTTYSLNAQMSRNVVGSEFASAQQNFYYAYRAMTENNRAYAVDQIAATAIRMRTLYGELKPSDKFMTLAVQSTFTRHVSDPLSLKTEILKRIQLDDKNAQLPVVVAYYEALLTAWLTPSVGD